VDDARGCEPVVTGSLNPRGHRYGSNVSGFSYQINDGPVIVASLALINREFSQFATPQTAANSKARIARSPFKVAGSGSCQSVRASSAVKEFPSRHPSFFAPFTRRMAAARSGLNNPESAASYACRRTAAS
jgi:hypothetical protein